MNNEGIEFTTIKVRTIDKETSLFLYGNAYEITTATGRVCIHPESLIYMESTPLSKNVPRSRKPPEPPPPATTSKPQNMGGGRPTIEDWK